MPTAGPAIPVEARREVLFQARHRCAVCCEPTPQEYAHLIPWRGTQGHSEASVFAPIHTDYNEESFYVRHAYFLGQNDPYSALKTTLKAEIDAEAWESLHSAVSRPFPKPTTGRIAVKVINHLGDEVMKVFAI